MNNLHLLESLIIIKATSFYFGVAAAFFATIIIIRDSNNNNTTICEVFPTWKFYAATWNWVKMRTEWN